ncbi:hypothetical protein [Kitasatospora cystarginea]|uniref:hypothetical protein n=1 Tax=Kitasatospora cystarginea TaxID=58350 RepID=UPI0031DDD5BB
MSFLGMWVLAAVPDEVVDDVAPVLGPHIDGQRELARTQELWRRWSAAPERVGGLRALRRRGSGPSMALDADSEAFQELSSACPLDEHCEEIYAALDRIPADWRHLALAPGCRKGFPVAALAHGLGPRRFALLPGWFGDMVLTSQQVRETLPDVVAALELTAEQRREARQRAVEWLCDSGDGDPGEAATMLDGVVPLWHAAVERQAGLLGCMFIPG